MAVVVLGMHRSGTSALTRCLNLMGLDLGPEAGLIPGAEENPRGFWENAAITALNEEILEQLGGAWLAPPVLGEAWWRDDRLAPLRDRARSVLAETFGDASATFKDPRTCLTLPFWREVLGRDPVVVLIRRHPLEVWRSLEKRNGLGREAALALWTHYNASALDNAAGLPVFSISFESLLENPRARLRALSAFLETHGVEGLDVPPVETLAGFLDPGLRHWTASADDEDGQGLLPSETARLLQSLEALPERSNRFEAPVLLPEPVRRDGLLLLHGTLSARLREELTETRESHRSVREALEARIEGERAERVSLEARRREDEANAVAVERRLRERVAGALAGRAAPGRSDEPPEPAHRDYDILIPIYDAHDEVKACVESVLRHTEPRHAVHLLDDASPDPRIPGLLEGFAASDPRVRVHRAASNLGFLQNVNRGFALSRRDVVILNSDTLVTPEWLDRLDRCARSDVAIGVVSPLSNNATILSVPEMNASNELPEEIGVDRMADLVARSSRRAYPRLPTAVGFCMLITRGALDRAGSFDPAYGLGYGEENDLCMRVWEAGLEVVCCDDAYVHHRGEASFSAVKKIDERRLRNRELLDRRWPRYHPAVFGFCRTNPLREVQERIGAALRRRRGESRPHVLHVLHAFDREGGTELHTRRLIDGLADRYRSTALYPVPQRERWTDLVSEQAAEHLRLARLSAENAAAVENFLGLPADLTNRTVESNVARFIAGGDHDLVHIQHLAGWSSLTLPHIAHALGKRVVISLHDYFLLCPDFNLMDPGGHPCGKNIAGSRDGDCHRCLESKRHNRDGGRAVLLHEYLAERAALARRILLLADAVVAPSEFVRERFARALGPGIADLIRVVPHGVERPEGRPARSRRGKRLRVAFLGHFTERKGGRVFLEAASRLRGEPVRLEVIGGVQPELRGPARKSGLVLRGAYRASQLPDRLGSVDLVVMPTLCEETFGLTVVEAQALGVPVLASEIGAIPERIVDGRTGFLTPAGDAAALARRLRDLARDPGALEAVHERLAATSVRTIAENVEDYAALYAEVLGRRDGGTALVRALLGQRPGRAEASVA